MNKLEPFELVPILGLIGSYDTYGWLLHDTRSGQTLLVDAPEDAPIQDALDARGWRLSAIWLTHHHHDHINAAPDLAARHNCPIWGPESEAHRLPPLQRGLKPGERIPFADIEAECIDIPGHARGQLAFYFAVPGVVFCADSLMSLGCGRLFEGTAREMWQALSRLKALPPDTYVASGHEIAQSNAKFALHLDPENPELISRCKEIDRKRANNEPTVPVVLEQECKTNPFLRVDNSDFQMVLRADGSDPATLLGEIRARKDTF